MTYREELTYGRKCHGLTLAEQFAENLIASRRWNEDSSYEALLKCTRAWQVHYSPFKVAA